MDGHSSQDPSDVWTPPESSDDSRYPGNASSTFTPVTRSFSSSATATSSNQSNDFVDDRYVTDQYHDDNSRVQNLQYSAPAYRTLSVTEAQGFQAPQSSFDRISPVNDYRGMSSGSSRLSYNSMQSEANQLMATQAVHSSSLQSQTQGYHVLGSDPRVMGVQRVISPVDCTVSQSALSLTQQDADEEHQTHTLLPVTSVPRYPVVHFSSHSEVSTTGGSPLMSNAQDRDDDNAISSLSGTLQESMMQAMALSRKSSRGESINGEPDTTQEDNDDYQVQNYIMEEPHNFNNTEPMLHSTVMATPGPSGHQSDAHTIMDSTLDSTGIASSSLSSNSLSSNLQGRIVTLPTGQLSLDSINRSVDSSGLGQPSMSVSGTGIVSMNNLHRIETPMESRSVVQANKDPIQMQLPVSIVNEINVAVRKSNRLAEMENEPPSWQRPKFKPKPYNVNMIWCDECQTTYENSCPAHRLTYVPDKVVLSRAWASLPSMLQIFRLNEEMNQFSREPHVGVFAKRPIPKLTQFGPFIGELVTDREHLGDVKFLLLLDRAQGDVMYFDTTDENKCNWMMFVRPAENYAEQNLVAYQHGTDIYFTVTKNIDARGELKVWYSQNYAARFGLQNLEITDQDIQVLDQQECRFQCYECSKRFRTSLALQRHIVMSHDMLGPIDAANEQSTNEEAKGRPLSVLQSGMNKRRGRPPKKDFENYVWKKKSTSLYLSKTLKKYQRRHDPDAIRRTIQSLYKRKGKESGGNEWLCVHCDLTFDNSNLLNLHTLTHAAEDVGMDEVRKFACGVNENGLITLQEPGMSGQMDDTIVSIDSSTLACPVCHAQFTEQRALIDHAAEHGTAKRRTEYDRPHKCEKCWKSFHTQEKLQKHMLCHGDEESKPLQCDICFKRFMNNSALSCHLKTHSDRKYYECPICHMGFDHTASMKEHVVEHAVNGIYTCPDCAKQFSDFLSLRKHIRSFHTNKEFPCPHCDKVFPRPDKLKLHMLRHSNHREFMCETCGRQFKRKDKLKEHIRRMHSLEREARIAAKGDRANRKKFIPKVSPSDYHRFIYKCHTCMHGFKRRGMLVNHLAKRHPDVKPEDVPELNLPILKTQKDYYCQYCEKVYKSSSKRKAHILKNHPGAELPMSSRKKCLFPEIPGLPNPTFSQTVGSVTTMPHLCEFCHKQYASKAKLTQHQRKKHPDIVPPLPPKPKLPSTGQEGQSQLEAQSNQETTVLQQVVRYDPDTVITVHHTPVQDGQQDLLTQAMSELTQSLQQEFRPATVGEFQIQRVSGAGGQTLLQLQAAPLQHGQSTIELSQLTQALGHVVPQGITIGTPLQVAMATNVSQASTIAQQVPESSIVQVSAPSSDSQIQTTVSQVSQAQVLSAPQTIVVSGTQAGTLPVALTPAAYLQRAWPTYTNFR